MTLQLNGKRDFVIFRQNTGAIHLISNTVKHVFLSKEAYLKVYPMGRISSPGRGKTFLLSTSSRLVLGPTQLPIQ
jgi:hypothetical protein